MLRGDPYHRYPSHARDDVMTTRQIQRVHVIDSHTGGEPTRIVIGGGPDLGNGTMAERRALLRDQFDHFRRAVVNEPRGSDVIVGGLLCRPSDPTCDVGVIFFNNADVLHMCGHGTIGLMATLAHLDRIQPGEHRIETSVGIVRATLHNDGRVTVVNVPSYRHRTNVELNVAGVGPIAGDVAWGGNWFFLVNDHQERLDADNIPHLLDVTRKIRQALEAQGITGAEGEVVDHIELFGPSSSANADSRNFVFCPGGEYDRSPCGTGTSAKLACLQADGKLAAGQAWRQESIIGSVFEGTFTVDGEAVIPAITGEAFVNAEATLLLDEADPFCWGIGNE